MQTSSMQPESPSPGWERMWHQSSSFSGFYYI